MKLKAEILIAFTVLCGAAFAADPVKETAKETAEPVPAAAAAETDEIDLDKLDDSEGAHGEVGISRTDKRGCRSCRIDECSRRCGVARRHAPRHGPGRH